MQPGRLWLAGHRPSEQAAREQYRAHLRDAHIQEVDADIPDGMVQVQVDDGEWRTVTPEEAHRLHAAHHEATRSDSD
ncbi:hypothetical protein ACFQH6_19755 [Halobacteriaceae archaeon GCM10025711]